MPVLTENLPTDLSFLTSNSRPTIKSKNAIPNSERILMSSRFLTIPKTAGPMRMPATTYPKIKGCFAARARLAKTAAKRMISPISRRMLSKPAHLFLPKKVF